MLVKQTPWWYLNIAESQSWLQGAYLPGHHIYKHVSCPQKRSYVGFVYVMWPMFTRLVVATVEWERYIILSKPNHQLRSERPHSLGIMLRIYDVFTQEYCFNVTEYLNYSTLCKRMTVNNRVVWRQGVVIRISIDMPSLRHSIENSFMKHAISN